MSFYPTVMGYRGHGAFGLYADFEDPLGYNQLQANLSISPASNITSGEQFHADVSYRTLYWHIQYWHNNANFYDCSARSTAAARATPSSAASARP